MPGQDPEDARARDPEPMRIGIVAGEASGDRLGAGLVRALAERHPRARFEGVAGPAMQAAGAEAWYPAETLAVMGLTEVLRDLPRLWRLRRELVQRWSARPPSVFVGIDAPDFNLGLEERLRRRGVPTVQYVSPSVWAWRRRRIARIRRACDRVLCLLPFERAFYDEHGVAATFVGHPLAEEIPAEVDRAGARASLGLGAGPVVALLPGSRRGEVERLGPDFAAAAGWLDDRLDGAEFVAPLATAATRAAFERMLAERAPGCRVRLLEGGAQRALAAADAALVASGTATLEAALSRCPMVVAYRVSPLTYRIVRVFDLIRLEHFSLPNLLAGRPLVPELFQEEVTPQALGRALLDWLEHPARRAELEREFARIHRDLARGADQCAARAVLEVAAGQ